MLTNFYEIYGSLKLKFRIAFGEIFLSEFWSFRANIKNEMWFVSENWVS